jgi:hypothetical protein
MSGYASRAAEALEQQVRYWRMLEAPAYRDWIDRRHTIERERRGEAVYINSVMIDNIARVATAKGEPFWWAPQICSLIETVYPSMPPYTLTREALPSAGGFFWFAKPINLGDGSTLKAIAWGQVLPDPGDPPRADGGIRAKRFSALPRTLQQAPAISAAFFESNGELRHTSNDPTRQRWELPTASIFWSFGRNYQDQQARDLVTGGPPVGDYDGTAESKIFAACLAFLNQKILVSPRMETDRASRRRLTADRAPHEPMVRVVALRKAFERLSGADKSTGDPVEWSCHWLVSGESGEGFWRRQWYPSLGVHQPVFIGPYVKGDLDKPFKGPTKVVVSVHR